MANEKVGTVTHYYTNIGVGIVKLTKTLKIGDAVKFEGTTTNFEQPIAEMQYDHKSVEEAKSGEEIGIKVDEKVREGDEVYLV